MLQLPANWQLPLFWYRKIKLNSLRDWLCTKGSLTKKASRICHHVNVELLAGNWQFPSCQEANILGIMPRQKAFVREIFMICNGEKWWYARTVIPRQAIMSGMSPLRYLGTKPLANILFSTAGVRRLKFEIAPINNSHYEFMCANKYSLCSLNNLWGRRSKIVCSNKALLLTEVFLPDMLQQLP